MYLTVTNSKHISSVYDGSRFLREEIIKNPEIDKSSFNKLLLRVASDPDVKSLKIWIGGKESLTSRELVRYTNPDNTQGGLYEKTVEIDPSAYLSPLAVLIDNVKVRANSVVMGANVHGGNKIIDNAEVYNGGAFWLMS